MRAHKRAHCTRVTLCGNLQEKCRPRIPGPAFCGNLQQTCLNLFPGPAFCVEIYRKSAAHPFWGARFIWKFTGKTHTDISEEPFCIEINKKYAVHGFQDRHFVWTFTGKSVQGHCRRAILCGNLQEKGRPLR